MGLHSDPAPVIAPVVVSPACLAGPVEADQIQEPPFPAEIERPAGQPNAGNYPAWLAYVDRRRERAELAGLFYQGERNAYQHANELNAEQLRQCNAWAQSVDDAQ